MFHMLQQSIIRSCRRRRSRWIAVVSPSKRHFLTRPHSHVLWNEMGQQQKQLEDIPYLVRYLNCWGFNEEESQGVCKGGTWGGTIYQLMMMMLMLNNVIFYKPSQLSVNYATLSEDVRFYRMSIHWEFKTSRYYNFNLFRMEQKGTSNSCDLKRVEGCAFIKKSF